MSSPNLGETGRIHKSAFVISVYMLYGLVVLVTAVRFVLQIRVGRQYAADDGFLLFGFLVLTSAIIIHNLKAMDSAYLVTALLEGNPEVALTPKVIQEAFDYHKWNTIFLMLCWTSIISAKFSFLFFFKKLIDRRLGWLYVYWWVVLVFTVACLGYGMAVYYVGCPYYYDIKAMTCNGGAGKARLVAYARASMSLDVAGDLFILVIPTVIIWKIKVIWKQKVALAFSLCLTVFMIATTVIRLSGLVYNGIVDGLWESYWNVVSAEVGILMASSIACRSLYVAASKSKEPQDPPERYFTESFLRMFARKGTWTLDEPKNDPTELPRIPNAELTGMESFIDAQGGSKTVPALSDSGAPETHTEAAPLQTWSGHLA